MRFIKLFLVLGLTSITFTNTAQAGNGDTLVPPCYRCRDIKVPLYLKARYIAKGSHEGMCTAEDVCGIIDI